MSNDVRILRSELDTDPLGRGYSGMTDDAAAADLNTAYRNTPARETITGSELLNAVDFSEFAALTAAQKRDWLALCAVDTIATGRGVARAIVQDLFGGPSGANTRAAMVALLGRENQSRARELGLGKVSTYHVARARAL